MSGSPDKPSNVGGARGFFRERLNVAWVASGVLLGLVVLLTPNHGWGTATRIVAAAIAIGLSGAARIRDARRDRERKAREGGARSQRRRR